jgi:hypothetical protein
MLALSTSILLLTGAGQGKQNKLILVMQINNGNA